ncbi:N-substituted formamide deformylase [bacterium HR33]|nr:N-substituted formamide deformylase [bacterium HR33]
MPTRREFLESSVAFAAALGIDVEELAPGLRIRPPERQRRPSDHGPEMVVINARVYTMADALPRAQAFAVKNGRFLAVGSTSDIRNLVTRGTEVIDAAGLTVVPGFIDAHCHPSGVNELIGVNVNLSTVEEVKAALRKKAATTPPGYWVTGYMYDDTKLDRPVTRRDLDEAVPDHPAMVAHRGGHTAVYNSKAFELAGVTAETPDPPGGKFYRENGELTGKVAERARAVFNNVGKREEITRDTRRAGIKFISEQMTKAGLTSVHQTGGNDESLIALQDAYAAGEMRFRMYFFPRGETYQRLKAAGVRTGFGDEWLRIGPVKYTADGSASERTMRMSTPYVGRPNDYGILTMTQEEIHEAVEDAHRNDWRIGIHANGDVTIDMVLNAYERVLHLWPKEINPRHRIEHCSLVNPDLLRRIKATGAIPTPFYTYVYYHGDKWAEYGEEKMRWMFAHRSFLDYGIPVAPASDYMPGPYEPMMALQSMVTRRDFRGREWGPNQRITVEEALRICTVNGAYASFEEHLKGSITPGKLADFVILGRDPHEVDPLTLKDIPIVRTVVGGKTMYRAD